MRYSHIVIPGVFAEMLEGIESTIENLPSKSDQASGKSSNVNTTWYGGGYVSHIEDSTFIILIEQIIKILVTIYHLLRRYV